MSQAIIDELRARCIELLHKSLVVDKKIPSLQGVCEILEAIKGDVNNGNSEELQTLLAKIVEQGERANNLALVKSNIADTL